MKHVLFAFLIGLCLLAAAFFILCGDKGLSSVAEYGTMPLIVAAFLCLFSGGVLYWSILNLRLSFRNNAKKDHLLLGVFFLIVIIAYIASLIAQVSVILSALLAILSFVVFFALGRVEGMTGKRWWLQSSIFVLLVAWMFFCAYRQVL